MSFSSGLFSAVSPAYSSYLSLRDQYGAVEEEEEEGAGTVSGTAKAVVDGVRGTVSDVTTGVGATVIAATFVAPIGFALAAILFGAVAYAVFSFYTAGGKGSIGVFQRMKKAMK